MNALLSALLRRLRPSRAEPAGPSAAELARVRSSGLFDADWYLEAYLDVAEAGVDPLLHFMMHGHLEERDPGPNFSTSGYRVLHEGRLGDDANPLLSYLQDPTVRPAALPRILGFARPDPGPHVLVCAHLVGAQAFGAELALPDVVRALRQSGYNVVVSAPGIGDRNYLDLLRQDAVEVAVVPHRWWRQGRTPCAATLEHFRGLITRHDVRAVHLNTIVLFEQAVAARQGGVPVVLHARELPLHDEALCSTLGADAPAIREHVRATADRLLANSRVVANYYGVDDPAWTVPDCVHWDDLPAAGYVLGQPLKVGLISSNLPKKGLDDFVELARLLEGASPEIQCILVGPLNEHVGRLQDHATLPANLRIAGFAPSPAAALQQIDVVVNLSRVQESFGRTVAEAMASGRPVVCYAWGALPELVLDGKTGYLVPFGDLAMAAARLRELAASPERYRELSDAARSHARAMFGFDRFAARLGSAYRELLGPEPATTARGSDTASPDPD